MVREQLILLQRGANELRKSSPETRRKMLTILADSIEAYQEHLLSENAKDCEENSATLNAASIQRLALSSEKITTLSRMMRDLASKPDPLGAVITRTELDDGLILEKVSVPIGVFAVIFESRPDIFFQILGLALRTGNAVVLKGGSEARHTNHAMWLLAKDAFAKASLPSEWFLLIEGREAVGELLRHDDLIDLIIPRGSQELVQSIQASTRIPVLGHASGVCHLYVHAGANTDLALRVIVDAKTHYPAACNAVETLLVDTEIASSFLPMLRSALLPHGVHLRGCARSCPLLGIQDEVQPDEWHTEYGTLTLAIKVVADIDEAIRHIDLFGSRHTDGIITQDSAARETFLAAVDSAGVYANCSTRFADGYRYGFGAEIGIGTGKLHARGPVGMEGLLTYKYLLRGNGHIVETYTGDAAKPFSHRRLPAD